ncbi:hypothetical protein [Chromobacterium sp. ATCC 53434]|uniref:hypothetical protein n=1 Tax=Chromobacterium sp. (strain ATCC 53434 / SC 14030) TaxID=2059672 RepID=UPI0013053813|nr:hypothetical protein [Chromobacterium sp. ATCC 53434]
MDRLLTFLLLSACFSLHETVCRVTEAATGRKKGIVRQSLYFRLLFAIHHCIILCGFVVGVDVKTKLILFLSTLSMAASAQVLVIEYPRPESSGDKRYTEYYWDVLRLAMSRTRSKFGEYAIRESLIDMNEKRTKKLIELGADGVDIMVHGNISSWGVKLNSIQFPLDKGVLGYRIFLLRKDKCEEMLAKSSNDLKSYTIGQGSGWEDIEILRDGGFRAVDGGSYENLFKMLSEGRFDLFSRGVNEIKNELDWNRNTYPNLTIEPRYAIYYPLARYFYVARTSKGAEIKKRLLYGLDRISKDGSLDALFNERIVPTISDLHIGSREIFYIKNRFISDQDSKILNEKLFRPAREATSKFQCE